MTTSNHVDYESMFDAVQMLKLDGDIYRAAAAVRFKKPEHEVTEEERLFMKQRLMQAIFSPYGEGASHLLEQAAMNVIQALGDDPTREGLRDTPRRFRDAFLEDFMPNGTPHDALAEMVMEEKFDQLIMVRDIPIRSFCEHHILPWFGRVAVGYIPQDRTVGLSKMTRMVAAAGKGLTIQERVTEQLVEAMSDVLRPLGCIVVIEATHTCTLLRGVRTELQRFTTSAAKGVFLTNPAPRQEFLTLLGRP